MESESLKNQRLQERIRKLYEGKYGGISSDEVQIFLTEELIKGTKRLNYLTCALIGLTVILAILTGMSIYKP